MSTLVLLFIALVIAVDGILAHTRINDLERDLHTLSQRMERLDARRADELRHLHVLAQQAFGSIGSPAKMEDYP